MAKHVCPACGQSLKGILLGVYFTPTKHRILSSIMNRRMPLPALALAVYGCEEARYKRRIQSNITKINDDLAGTDYRIKGPGQGNVGGNYLLARSLTRRA